MYNSLYQQFRIAAKCRGSQWQIYLLLAAFALCGIGGTPISHRQKLLLQRTACIAGGSVACMPYFSFSASASASISAICCSFSEDLIVTFCSSTVRFLHFSSIAPI